MNSLATPKNVILMKSGLTLLVDPQTADVISTSLSRQSAHTFFRIKELGETINSAEIEGIYSPSKYEELLKTKSGEYRCSYDRWHKKRESCNCKYDIAKEREEQLRQVRFNIDNSPLTDAQRLERDRIIKKMRTSMQQSGILK